MTRAALIGDSSCVHPPGLPTLLAAARPPSRNGPQSPRISRTAGRGRIGRLAAKPDRVRRTGDAASAFTRGPGCRSGAASVPDIRVDLARAVPRSASSPQATSGRAALPFHPRPAPEVCRLLVDGAARVVPARVERRPGSRHRRAERVSALSRVRGSDGRSGRAGPRQFRVRARAPSRQVRGTSVSNQSNSDAPRKGARWMFLFAKRSTSLDPNLRPAPRGLTRPHPQRPHARRRPHDRIKERRGPGGGERERRRGLRQPLPCPNPSSPSIRSTPWWRGVGGAEQPDMTITRGRR
jgi:hypothetical protein